MKKLVALFFLASLANLYPMRELVGNESEYDEDGSFVVEYWGDPIQPENLQQGQYTPNQQLETLRNELRDLLAQDLRDPAIRQRLQDLSNRAHLHPTIQRSIRQRLERSLRPLPAPLELEL